MPAKHIMIDLETLSFDPTAAVIQIGAATDKGGGFCVSIDFESALLYGNASGSTLEWWLKQSEDARGSLFNDPVNSMAAFSMFKNWIDTVSDKDTVYWAHATFDFPILQRVSQKVLGKAILPFMNKQYDLSTVEYLYGEYIEWEEREGVHHNAGADAMHQMKNLIKMLQVFEAKHIGGSNVQTNLHRTTL